MKKVELFAGLFLLVMAALLAVTFGDAGIALAIVPIVGAVSSAKLKEKRSTLIQELEGILSKAKEENRDFTDEENQKRDSLRAEIEKLDKDIDRRIFEEQVEARSAGKFVNDQNEKREDEEMSKFSLVRAMNILAKGGSLTGLEAELHAEAEKEFRKSGINAQGNLYVPSRLVMAKRNREAMAEKRTALLAGSGGGANFVQTDVTDFIGALYDKNVLVGLGAKLLSGLVGNIQIPVSGGGSADWEGESDSNADGTPAITNKTASPKRLGAYGTVSKTLLSQQGNYDVEMLVRDDLVNAINQALQVAAIEGAGSNDPTGILNTSGIGSVLGGANGASPTGDHIVELEKEVAVDKADVGSLGFLTNPYVRGILKKTALDAGSGIMVWDRNIADQLMGYKAGVTTAVPNDLIKGEGTALSAIIFGNFADLMMLQWGGFDIVVDPYTGAKTNQLNIVINSFWDIIIRRAVSFAAMKDAITTS